MCLKLKLGLVCGDRPNSIQSARDRRTIGGMNFMTRSDQWSSGLLITGFLILTSCGIIPDQQLKIRETGVFTGSGRVAIDLTQKDLRHAASEMESPKTKRRGSKRVGGREKVIPRALLEVTLAGSHESTAIEGFSSLDGDYRIFEGTLGARLGGQYQRARFDLLTGLGYNEMKLSLSGSQSKDRESNRLGIYLGLDVGVEAWEWLELYGRATFMALPIGASSGRHEIGARFFVHPSVGIALAYHGWRYRNDESFPNSDIDIRTQGFLLGAEFRF